MIDLRCVRWHWVLAETLVLGVRLCSGAVGMMVEESCMLDSCMLLACHYKRQGLTPRTAKKRIDDVIKGFILALIDR